MIFTSVAFLLFYALLMLFLLAFRGDTTRQYILLISSYIFYGWWNPAFVVLIFVTSLWGWYLGILIDRTDDQKKKSRYLALSLTLSLATLAYYKYAEFLAQNLVMLLGLEWDCYFGITLPVGISFFTFQTMSYGIDLKRGRILACKSLSQFMLFVAFFPQLVAGPIVRASEFLPQLLHDIKITRTNMVVGAQLFIGGMTQKVLFADNLSVFVDPVFDNPELYSGGTLWLGVVAYSMQIFCDFSGYSLMAIGVAKTLGFSLPKNFDMPYVAKSITEFWRRWHMTLSFWLRDYLYVPLGGNRKGSARTYLNLSITMLLGGLWHGASWNFVLWGALHGGALAFHKLWTTRTESWGSFKETTSYKIAAWGVTYLFVLIAWVPFRCDTFDVTLSFYNGLFGNETGIEWINPMVVLVLLVMAVWHLFYLYRVRQLMQFPVLEIQRLYPQFVIGGVLLLIAMFGPVNTSPFIYFQF